MATVLEPPSVWPQAVGMAPASMLSFRGQTFTFNASRGDREIGRANSPRQNGRYVKSTSPRLALAYVCMR
ncbi:hypothetical protein C2E23DRAFT_826500 [Lenzites betulinus]|nr:hypothetical protein C2E23DRAFT_826500 [Lenzites betulinus]